MVYVKDRYSGVTRSTTTATVQSLASSFFGRRRRLDEGTSEAFSGFLLNVSDALLTSFDQVGLGQEAGNT